MQSQETTKTEWQKTACILCSLNCGIDVQVGGPGGRHLVKIKGDQRPSGLRRATSARRRSASTSTRPAATVSTRRCAAAPTAASSRSTGTRRSARSPRSSPTSRRATAATRFSTTAAAGRGTISAARYGSATLAAVGNRYRSNALAQEKTGEFWVNGQMIGAGTHGDFDHCEVAVFIGKNPWQSHGFARARATIREIVKDPKRSIVVIDPRRSETAEKADFHLAIKPGTDAWCLAALVAIIVQENLVRRDWVAEHTTGFEEIEPQVPRDRRRRRTPRRAASTRTSCAASRGASPAPRACRCTRISACRCRCTRRSAATCSGSSGC